MLSEEQSRREQEEAYTQDDLSPRKRLAVKKHNLSTTICFPRTRLGVKDEEGDETHEEPLPRKRPAVKTK